MKELDILELRKLYKDDMVFLTSHCSIRLEQRGITEDDIESALNNGEIIEQYPDDYPWPNCLILKNGVLILNKERRMNHEMFIL